MPINFLKLLTVNTFYIIVNYVGSLPSQKYLNKLKFVSQVAHDRDTCATSNKSPEHDLKPLGIQVYNDSMIF